MYKRQVPVNTKRVTTFSPSATISLTTQRMSGNAERRAWMTALRPSLPVSYTHLERGWLRSLRADEKEALAPIAVQAPSGTRRDRDRKNIIDVVSRGVASGMRADTERIGSVKQTLTLITPFPASLACVCRLRNKEVGPGCFVGATRRTNSPAARGIKQRLAFIALAPTGF